ncbi:hypothetical protein P154DRAFT_579939 [Amniculicola lignicola CBS 123094]|uniref:Uncharacterized protein n=1 Tax=Amniculicola lignicola CBS 123094 TaxID=1392246 RepID=A0A6A5W8B6_9PLEO|nr:hypothetical protein P154DRAFT_579939 [Amniculicola lignicola CBS 123094]
MPPKKDTSGTASEAAIVGFDMREVRLLAAAYIASIGTDKYDYDLMATLTGYTAGSLKKLFPPVKRKAVGLHPSLAAFLALPAEAGDVKAAPKKAAKKSEKSAEPEETDGDAVKNEPKKTVGKKRKTPDTEPEENMAAAPAATTADKPKAPKKTKKGDEAAVDGKAKGKKRGRPAKKDTTPVVKEEDVAEADTASTVGGDDDSKLDYPQTDNTFDPGSAEWIEANFMSFAGLTDESLFEH